MQDQVAMDEIDRLIVTALQASPRASWTQIGAVLGIDPVTGTRRWQRLHEAGVAWVTAYAGIPGPLALVEIDCAGDSLGVAAQLLHDPECASIDVTSGGRDLLITVNTDDDVTMTDYLLTRLGRLDQVRAVRTHMVTRVIAEGAGWRLRELTVEQLTRLSPPGRGGTARLLANLEPTRHGSRLTEEERRVLACLAEDGRMPTAEIAARLDRPVRRMRDQIRTLLSERRVTLRTELQAAATEWPIYAWLFLRMPSRSLDTISPQLGSLPEIRSVMQVAGPSNVIMAVWLRELTDVSRLEAAIESKLRDVAIVDRSVVLRTTKRVGVLLGDDGRAAVRPR
ncbi:MAG: Lrp/AsnC family transcriptional regulator [Nocardioides sp.]|uniref:Lrp/AsnC family transcriptional regulator n=1 Tax=Nocardioides sp. TaxID=35761 RepID=UPI0039E66EE1